MRQDKKQKDRSAVVLVLCFCMMALVSVFVVKANIDKVRDNMSGDNVADVVKEKAVDEKKADKPMIVDSAENASGKGSDGKSDDETDRGTAENSSDEYIVPLNGEIIMDYSVDMPIYWKTLDQYMTHNGIDIAAPAGSSVSACAGGTITKIEEDDKLGIIAEINHGNGVISLYGNLANDGLVEVGDVVAQGDIIGKVGQSSMFEFESPDHLHFEMRVNGDYADPADYMKL